MLLLSPSSSGPLFSPTFSKLEKETPELSCERRVNLLCSYLIWSEDQLRILVLGFFLDSTLFHFEFLFLCSSQPLWLFCISVSQFSLSCSLSLAFSFHFFLALFSLPLPGWYKAVVWVLRRPWSVCSSESTLKGHFIMFMKQHLRPSSNMAYQYVKVAY